MGRFFTEGDELFGVFAEGCGGWKWRFTAGLCNLPLHMVTSAYGNLFAICKSHLITRIQNETVANVYSTIAQLPLKANS